jgi:hypothetical protein
MMYGKLQRSHMQIIYLHWNTPFFSCQVQGRMSTIEKSAQEISDH